MRLAYSTLQCKLLIIWNKWWTSLTERTQTCTDTGIYRGFYKALKAAYGPSYQIQSPLWSANGQELLADKESVLNCWSEYFHTFFSTSHTVQESVFDRIHQQLLKTKLDMAPTLQETVKAVEQLKSGKAMGIDGIPPEV